MSTKKILVGDFETTVFKDQTYTEVWSSACVELNCQDVFVFHSIDEQWEYFKALDCDLIVYYHNLKFDGSFWLYYFLTKTKLTQAYIRLADGSFTWLPRKKMSANTFQYAISDMGQFYNIYVKLGKHTIEFRDSLKLLPFKLATIGSSFGTAHQKLEMEYKGKRYAGCKITEEEMEYIKNDVLVAKEALEIMFDEGHNRLTIGSCCLAEYKQIVKKSLHPDLIMREWEEIFPDLRNFPLDISQYGYDNAEAYIRKSYKGAWCYVVPEKANKLYTKGLTADVNSLYPSVMHSDSGSVYPIGLPKFWKGDYIPDEAKGDNKFFFIRIKTRFKVKEGKLPFIQIKGTHLYKSNECLKTSDIKNPKTGRYSPYHIDIYGKHIQAIPELTMTSVDFELFKEHYDLFDTEILDGCWFYAVSGIFDDYINKYAEIKMTTKGAKRQLAKLFLNNLYGKFASSDDSSFKVAFIKENGALGYVNCEEHEKAVGYIPVGSAITSYARNFTIRTAQKNYYGCDKAGFIYADTDSIHCDLEPEQLVGVPVDPVKFCHWKLEALWDNAIFVRQKTYIEHVTHEDLQLIEKPYYNIKCAGMGSRPKELFNMSLTGEYSEEDCKTEEEKKFLYDKNNNKIKRTLTDFKLGLTVPSNLKAKNIIGGVLLVESDYKMR